MVADSFNPSTRGAEVGASLRVQGHPGLQSEIQNSQGRLLHRRTMSQKRKGISWYKLRYAIHDNQELSLLPWVNRTKLRSENFYMCVCVCVCVLKCYLLPRSEHNKIRKFFTTFSEVPNCPSHLGALCFVILPRMTPVSQEHRSRLEFKNSW